MTMKQVKIYTHSPYTGQKYDENNDGYKWNIIITANFPPEIDDLTRQIVIDIQYTPLNEIDFINRIFNSIPLIYVVFLVKISACHIRENEENFPWMKKRNGKYFFNTDINDDKDTKFWNRKRIEFINNAMES